jgi:hypothetical protein
MPALEHGDAGAHARRLKRNRQPGETGADDANIDIEVEREPGMIAQCGIMPLGASG